MDFQTALNLLNASFDSIWQNLGKALKVSLIPFTAFLMIAGILFHREIVAALSGVQPEIGQFTLLRLFLVLGSGMFLFFLSAVLWHRAVLLPNSKKRFPLKETLFYLLRALLLGLGVGVVIGIIAGFVLFFLGGGQFVMGDFLHSYRQGWGLVVLNLVATWLFWAIYVALSPRLVHSALGGTNLSFEALRRKQNLGPVIRAVGLVITLCLVVNSAVGLGLAGAPVLLQMAAHIVILWLATMMSISLLTEYYDYSLEQPETVDADNMDDAQPNL